MRLDNVAPADSPDDERDVCLRRPETVSNGLLGQSRSSQGADFSHVGFGEFCPSVPLASGGRVRVGVFAVARAAGHTPLSRGVGQIVLACASKKMIRAHAWRVVAMMAGHFVRLKGSPDGYFKGQSMCLVGLAPESDAPVAVNESRATPEPATSFGSGDASPEQRAKFRDGWVGFVHTIRYRRQRLTSTFVIV